MVFFDNDCFTGFDGHRGTDLWIPSHPKTEESGFQTAPIAIIQSTPP